MFLTKPALLALWPIALISAGCGGGEDRPDGRAADERAVKDTMKTYLGALADGDGNKACDQLMPEAKRQVVKLSAMTLGREAASCPAALGRLVKETGANVADEVCGARDASRCKRLAKQTAADVADELKDVETKVEVRGDSASAGPAAGPEGYEARLRKIDGEWLISNVGGL
ncbi:MAG: hypothetical protein M3131_02665 [Actinomycetota bacterium]|nr:hypothetical protein [Actinomycetota bacterium]